MNIFVEDSKNNILFYGEYCYLEGGSTNGKPSFSIVAYTQERKEFEFLLFADSEEEFDKFIENLEKINEKFKGLKNKNS